jgi:hypothetical protein
MEMPTSTLSGAGNPGQIPMSAALGSPAGGVRTPEFVDPAANQLKSMKLQEAQNKADDNEQTRSDQDAIQEYLSGGGNLSTPDGMASAVDQLKGKVSPKTYLDMVAAHNNSQRLTDEHIEFMSKQELSKLERGHKVGEEVLKHMQSASDAYDNAIKEGRPDEAMADFNATKAANIQELRDMKLVPPDKLTAYEKMTPEQLRSAISTADYTLTNMEKAAKLATEKARAASLEGGGAKGMTYQSMVEQYGEDSPQAKAALAAMAGAGGRSRDAGFQLTPEQNDALFGIKGAVTTGKLDIKKVNSRTAGLLANAAIKNPDTDFEAISANISMERNATFRTKEMNAETLPQVMKNMVAAGKKLGYNDVQFIGKLQQFKNKQLNDPLFIKYLGQRNDALMGIASVMRGTGMSDFAHKAEVEAASPTLSPDGLDAWLEGQMESLGPRLAQYDKIRNKIPFGKSLSEPTKEDVSADIGPAPGAAAAAAADLRKIMADPRISPDDKANAQIELLRMEKQIGKAKPSNIGAGPVKITSEAELKQAIKDGKLKLKGTFLGPDGTEHILKKLPE